MVLGRVRLPEPKNANLIADPQSQHYRLHPRRVVEIGTVVGLTPVLQWLPRDGNEPLERVVFSNSGAKHIEPRIRDQERRFVGRVADCVIEEVDRLANIHENGDSGSIRVAEAALPPRTEVKDVTIQKGDGRFRPNFGFKAIDSRIVQPNHRLMAINQLPIITVEENPAVPYDCTGGVFPVRDGELMVPVYGVLHMPN